MISAEGLAIALISAAATLAVVSAAALVAVVLAMRNEKGGRSWL